MFRVLGGRVTLCEGPAGYRPAEDSLWLATLAPKTAGNVCDVGCGTGAVTLAYGVKNNVRHKGTTLAGFDLNPGMIEAAQASAAATNLVADFRTGDVLAPPFDPGTFDLVLSNPPFYDPHREQPAQSMAKNSTKFTAIPLEEWFTAMVALAKPGGQLALVCHGADLEKMLACAPAAGCATLAVYRLKAHPEKQAKRVVLVCSKNTGNTPAPKHETVLTYDPDTRKHHLE